MKQEILNRQNDLAIQERQKEALEKELKHTVVECDEKTSENKSLQASFSQFDYLVDWDF